MIQPDKIIYGIEDFHITKQHEIFVDFLGDSRNNTYIVLREEFADPIVLDELRDDCPSWLTFPIAAKIAITRDYQTIRLSPVIN
jgi:hypothetical protein